MHLRWGKTSTNATPIQLVEPVINQDGVLSQDAGTATTDGWAQYKFQANCYAGSVKYRYTWYTMNGTPSTNYKSSMYYFFPNADDDNQLFKYDSVDIAGNYKKITVPEDDELVWTGTTNDDGKGWKVTGWVSR